jgi:hypothetical protein
VVATEAVVSPKSIARQWASTRSTRLSVLPLHLGGTPAAACSQLRPAACYDVMGNDTKNTPRKGVTSL